ncbi:hypothetical protein ANOBCDAF_03097 [Pleomorphomonas sp. T1.2MG-36]|uniref:YbhB/YbcL family Raf kinase inhibitor-like protein n=1 Tax=Pleomorphomonas sp. T1.2MG-36 TaxID=3041167 RepID=UPI0024774A2E|nr:YbhB/YbcL family Raf kinase inhibitor-like protein [Pleomorphomonas sp. T1.2MG-36]CAI9414022.1 hypothetical protein ANOBCDAF_03097 [Pleomorphomonas sp. T1.2MG-36]
MFEKTAMLKCLVAAAALAGFALPANAFELSFRWGATPACDSGRPAAVDSPEFALANVPPGTRVITFEMMDLNAPDFRHGGGTVPYTGEDLVPAGAFRYLGPCPPAGPHRYMWTAKARDRGTTFGRTLGEATATRSFPD